MYKTKLLGVLFGIILACSACQIVNSKDSEFHSNSISNAQLVLNSKVSLPLPTRYKDVFANESSIIISQSESSIGYRWIDKEEIEFIGSKKTPYQFFKSAFNDPSDDKEKRFLEGLGDTQKRSNSMGNNFEFYYLKLKGSQKLYILSRALDFVVEVTSNNDSKEYIEAIINQAYIK